MSLHSDEQLLLPRARITNTNLYVRELREQERERIITRSMAPTEAIVIERKISHGIGGAGNIRRPSDVMFAVKQKEAEDASGRRRSSVWSRFTPSPGSSPGDRRNSILSMFRGSGATDSDHAEFKKVETGGERRRSDA